MKVINKMDDYIRRQETIEALGDVPYVSDTWTDEYAIGEYHQHKKDKAAIESVTPADIEHVVRCKDCIFGDKYYFEVIDGVPDIWVECKNPNGLNRDVSGNGYCSAGIKNIEQGMNGKQNDRKTDKIDK